jgi:hypothetical protein
LIADFSGLIVKPWEEAVAASVCAAQIYFNNTPNRALLWYTFTLKGRTA